MGMTRKKGQIVEIPANSKLYTKEFPSFDTEIETIKWNCEKRNYSLFDGILVGEHEGLENYQYGQRKQLTSGGFQLPMYVIGFDFVENRLFVGQGKNHPGLRTSFFCIPKNRLSIDENNKKLLTQQVSFQLKNAFTFNFISTKIYLSQDTIYFWFDEEISLQFFNYPTEIYLDNQLIGVIKTINKMFI